MNVIEKYKSLCRKLWQGTSKFDVLKHNRAMDAIFKLNEDIKNMPDKSFMLDLMYDSDPKVRLSAAVNCLKTTIYISEATEVLEELSKIDSVMGKNCETINVSWNAHMSLELFRKGKL